MGKQPEKASGQRAVKESLELRFVRDTLFEGESGVDHPEFTFADVVSCLLWVVLAPNGHTTQPNISCIATHGAP